MAAMLAKYLVWLAPDGQPDLRKRLLVHFMNRVKHYVYENSNG